MDAAEPDILAAYPVRRNCLTVSDYHRLAEIGLLGARDRVEPPQGQLIDMSPIGLRHVLVLSVLTEMLSRFVAGTDLVVWPQNPVVLDDGSEPQPGVSLVRKPWAAHPGPKDIPLVIDVSVTSLAVDARQSAIGTRGPGSPNTGSRV